MEVAENKSTTLSDSEAVNALMGLTETSEDTSSTTEEVEVTEAAQQQDAIDESSEEDAEAAEPEAASADEDQPEEAEAQEAEATEESESLAPQALVEAQPTDILFHTEDGEPVTVEEAKRGHLRQADYTRKTQELAGERQKLNEEFANRQQEREVLAQNLTLALDVIQPELAELARTDWSALREQDAYAYRERRDAFELKQERYNSIVAQSQQLVQQQKQASEQQRQQRLAQEGEALKMKLPDIADPVKGPEVRAKMKLYAKEMGLSDAEAASITDHRVVIMMDKARRYDEMMKADRTVAQKKVSKAPKKSLKGGTPTTQGQRNQQQQKELQSKLRQSGRMEDAVELLMSRKR